jgi:hypothetical protein
MHGQRDVGRLFPDVILNDSNKDIKEIMQHDINQCPDLLCVMGASLTTPSLNTFIQSLAKKVKNGGGICVFINKELPTSQPEWHGVFDHHIVDEMEVFVRRIAVKWAENKEDEWAMQSWAEEAMPVVEWHCPESDETDCSRPMGSQVREFDHQEC